MTDHTEELDPFDQAYREALENAYQRISALEAENERLRAGMKGDYDLDAWLNFFAEKQARQSPGALAEQGERQEAVAWETRCNTERRFSVNQCSAEERAEHWRKNGRGIVEVAPLYYTTPQPGQDVRGLVEALEHARLFIRNGIELGFIRMPDADTPDPAHDTLPKIEKALASHRQAQQGDSHDT